MQYFLSDRNFIEIHFNIRRNFHEFNFMKYKRDNDQIKAITHSKLRRKIRQTDRDTPEDKPSHFIKRVASEI